jgi:hypothetical protein
MVDEQLQVVDQHQRVLQGTRHKTFGLFGVPII